jgi:hypothetical protein
LASAIAATFVGRRALEPAARLNPIEVAVDVELQQHRRMIRRPAGYLRIDPVEPKLAQIEFIDEDPVFKAFRKQRALPTIRPFNEALHPILPANRAGIISRESHQARRFHTARVNMRSRGMSALSQHWMRKRKSKSVSGVSASCR